MIAFRIKVKGKVQGVFFRASTQEKANQLNLKGWVRNEPDGSVLIEAEGKEPQLNKLIEWCAIGPSSAVVEDISTEQIQYQNHTDFIVTH